MRTQSPLITPITFKDDTGYLKAEVAFTYDANDITAAEDIVSYANFTPTTGGTHVNGFMDGLCTFMRNYMNKIYLGEKSKITVVNNDIKCGLKVIIAAAHLNPVFAGQFKGILSNEDMYKYVRDLTMTSLEEWSKRSTNDLQKVCKFIKEIAEIRMKSDDSKIKLSNSYEASLLTGKPKKYVPPSGHKNLELIIVEGDSALGSAKNSRDTKCQGLYPIKGKIPNAFKESKAKFLANEEIASIITLIGGGYGKNFDITKVKFDKVIFFADADPDGSHIDCLLLRFFLMYMPEMITAGRVYRAVPPLFGIGGKNGMRYFVTKLDFTKYIQGLFARTYTLADENGRRLTPQETTQLFFKNIDYKDKIETTAKTFAVEPDMLEMVLYYISNYIVLGQPNIVATMATKEPKLKTTRKTLAKNDTKSNNNKSKTTTKKESTSSSGDDMVINADEIPLVEKSLSDTVSFYLKPTFSANGLYNYLKKMYRFIKVIEENGVIRVEGLVNSRYQYLFINNKLISACISLLTLINNNINLYYMVSNEKVSLYRLMCKFDAMIPPGLTRFKGLGEQDPKELGESALRPDGNRTLIRYTMDSAKEEIETLRRIDSSMAGLLRSIKVTKADIE